MRTKRNACLLSHSEILVEGGLRLEILLAAVVQNLGGVFGELTIEPTDEGIDVLYKQQSK